MAGELFQIDQQEHRDLFDRVHVADWRPLYRDACLPSHEWQRVYLEFLRVKHVYHGGLQDHTLAWCRDTAKKYADWLGIAYVLGPL